MGGNSKMKTFVKNIFRIIVLPLFFYSCGSLEPEDQNESFFPMKVGNKWYYNSNPAGDIGSSTKWEIVSKQQFAGNDYYQLVKSYNTSFSDTLYYRIASNKLIELLIGVNPNSYYFETVCADFNLDANGSFEYYMGGFPGKEYYYKVTIKNKSEDEITFFYNSPNAVDEEHSITYKKGVGVSESYSDAWGIHSYLIHQELK